ncbi:MAG: hypothetical protein N5P05_002425 [Chroococcopsis gigantea SAG 12.99]|nr:hypothetical protein [Chroococcopsis gigantea SAG 12.99]
MVFGLGWLVLSGDSLRTQTTSLRNGLHLYGQSPQAEQIGQEYLVFMVKEDKIVGAVYLPSSEFSCFRGTINGGVLNLAILDPYENATYTHSIALKPSSPVAANGSAGQEIGLDGYYSIDKISNNDRRILRTCLSKFGGGR